MSPKNLFILSTPSQAFFLSKAPELIENAVLVVTAANKAVTSEILQYLQKFKFDFTEVIYVPGNNDKLIFLKILYFRIWLIRFTAKFKSFQNVFIGSYSNFYHLSIVGEYENKSSIFLLYDGMQIISVAHNRKYKDKVVRSLPKSFRRLKFKQPKIKALNLVAPFYLDVKSTDTCKIIEKGPSIKRPILDETKVIFVGQPLIELEIVSKDFYLETLRKIKKRYAGKKVLYLPHPRENKLNIQKIAEFLEIEVFRSIFEEEYVNSSRFPKTIVSFYSSVIVNLCYLKAETTIYVIPIGESDFLRKRVYDNYQLSLSFFKKIEDSKINITEF